MGDMADYQIEQIESEIADHEAGMCDPFCSVCLEEWKKKDPKGYAEYWKDTQ